MSGRTGRISNTRLLLIALFVFGGPVCGHSVESVPDASMCCDASYDDGDVPDGSGDTDSAAQDGDFYSAIFAVSSEDVFAVGPNGRIEHFDGLAWTAMESPTSASLWGIWGDAHDNVLAVGDGANVIRWDGSGWHPMDVFNYTDLYGIWGCADGGLFAVGDEGTIVRFDGEQWTPMPSGTNANLRGVWCASPDDVYAVGEATEQGSVLHYDGATWNYLGDVALDSASAQSPSYLPRHAVWGSSSSDVYVAGEGTLVPFEDCYGNVVEHFDGVEWKNVLVDECMEQSAEAVWGSSSTDVYVVSGAGEISHFDGEQWAEATRVSDVFQAFVKDIKGVSSTEIYAAGGYNWGSLTAPWQPELWRYDGAAWTPAFGPDN
jgi:hypothetical protein